MTLQVNGLLQIADRMMLASIIETRW